MQARSRLWRDEEAPEELPARERSQRTLARGVLFFRWVWLVWMTVLAASNPEFRVPALAWAALGVAAAWTVCLTATRSGWTRQVLYLDMIVCCALILVSGLVVPTGAVIEGRPFFASGYPLSAALSWGAALGPGGGVAAGILLGTAQLLSRPLNEVSLFDLTPSQLQNVLGAFLNYLVAGVAVGIVSRVLVRSAEAVDEASTKLLAERERAARLAEREKIARQIHDSVLQALAMVHKKGRELAAKPHISADEVAALGDMAAQQEKELRSLILRDPDRAPSGRLSLREELERTARGIADVDVTISSVGPLYLPAPIAQELVAAARQALENVARHARASRAVVFCDEEDGMVSVTVRDDGVGFVYDEAALERDGKVGILKSMKGRARDLGGDVTVASSPGRGTEVEFRVPVGGERR